MLSPFFLLLVGQGGTDGRVLLLSPWEYNAGKRHISRADCVALNAMAEEIAAM